MNRTYLFTILVFVRIVSFSQKIETSKPFIPEKNYFKTSKIQNTVASVLLSGGIVVLGVTAIKAAVGTTYNSVSNRVTIGMGGAPVNENKSYAIPLAVGVASMVASIPLFMASSANRKRGLNTSASLTIQSISSLERLQKDNCYYPSISFKIAL